MTRFIRNISNKIYNTFLKKTKQTIISYSTINKVLYHLATYLTKSKSKTKISPKLKAFDIFNMQVRIMTKTLVIYMFDGKLFEQQSKV